MFFLLHFLLILIQMNLVDELEKGVFVHHLNSWKKIMIKSQVLVKKINSYLNFFKSYS